MKCFDSKVKFYKVINDSTHVFIKEDFCIELEPDIYAQLGDDKFAVTYNPKPETLWNFSKISLEDKNQIKILVENNKSIELIKIANKYNLAGYTICCEDVIDQFKTAIKYNLI